MRNNIAAAALLALAGCGSEQGTQDVNLATAEGNAVDNLAEPSVNAAAAGAPAPEANNGEDYVRLVGGSDQFEIQSARLALEKTQSADVRELAQMILTDHERSTAELTRAARAAQIQAAPEMTPEHQSNLAALRAASEGNFDAEYLSQQVRAHEQALSLVTGYAGSGDVPALQAHASTVAGPIQAHLSRARTLAEQAARP